MEEQRQLDRNWDRSADIYIWTHTHTQKHSSPFHSISCRSFHQCSHNGPGQQLNSPQSRQLCRSHRMCSGTLSALFFFFYCASMYMYVIQTSLLLHRILRFQNLIPLHYEDGMLKKLHFLHPSSLSHTETVEELHLLDLYDIQHFFSRYPYREVSDGKKKQERDLWNVTDSNSYCPYQHHCLKCQRTCKPIGH